MGADGASARRKEMKPLMKTPFQPTSSLMKPRNPRPVMKMKLTQLTLVACLASSLGHADPLGTAFTYQGHLNDGTNQANGSYVFRFTMYDQASSGGTVGTNIT